MARYGSKDTDFMSDLRGAMVRGPRFSTSILFLAIIGFLVAAGYWTSQAKIPLVASGQGRVIPSSQIQVVQHLEGGILAEIHVKESQIVKKGDILLRVDDLQFESRYAEDYAKKLGLLAKIARLTAEVDGKEPVFPKEVLEADATLASGESRLAAREKELYRARQTELAASVSILQRQMEQKRQEIAEIDSRIRQLQRSLALAREEYDITKPMVDQGVTSRIELLRLERQINDIEGTLDTARESIPRARAALREAERRIAERRAAFRSQAFAELNDARVTLSALEESLSSMQDRVQRTYVRAPVTGTVKRLLINTPGGVIKPGMDLIEIVPLEDNLLVEARIRPSDIAFLHPGQEAKVKVTAYDFAIYGSLKAQLEQISADTIVDDKGESYYQIRVRTEKNYLGNESDPLPIIPGMIAQVDILTGDRTVLDYLLKPILRAQEQALRER